ncbi:MAG: NUDIX hydrolase [Candidatus Saganbacteria bacterium]|nr:NUDIX hydrolase [Candidatus Saganbacteria bacterium]
MINMRDDEVELSNGKISHREIVEHPGAVIVIGITPENKLVLIRQFRKPVEAVIVEACAGLVNKGEKLIDAAKRELKEETGYDCGKIKQVLSAYTSPGYSTEMIHYFVATDLKKGSQEFDEDENIEVFLISPKEAMREIREGKIRDNKTIIAIMLADEETSA